MVANRTKLYLLFKKIVFESAYKTVINIVREFSVVNIIENKSCLYIQKYTNLKIRDQSIYIGICNVPVLLESASRTFEERYKYISF